MAATARGTFPPEYDSENSPVSGDLVAAAKRPEQGAIAAEYADMVYLADEAPRGEDPMAILEDIAAGCPGLERGGNLFLIPDRREALKAAFKAARAGDLVAALGKGHEGSIIYADGPMEWDEAEACREALRELGFEA